MCIWACSDWGKNWIWVSHIVQVCSDYSTNGMERVLGLDQAHGPPSTTALDLVPVVPTPANLGVCCKWHPLQPVRDLCCMWHPYISDQLGRGSGAVGALYIWWVPCGADARMAGVDIMCGVDPRPAGMGTASGMRPLSQLKPRGSKLPGCWGSAGQIWPTGCTFYTPVLHYCIRGK